MSHSPVSSSSIMLLRRSSMAGRRAYALGSRRHHHHHSHHAGWNRNRIISCCDVDAAGGHTTNVLPQASQLQSKNNHVHLMTPPLVAIDKITTFQAGYGAAFVKNRLVTINRMAFAWPLFSSEILTNHHHPGMRWFTSGSDASSDIINTTITNPATSPATNAGRTIIRSDEEEYDKKRAGTIASQFTSLGTSSNMSSNNNTKQQKAKQTTLSTATIVVSSSTDTTPIAADVWSRQPMRPFPPTHVKKKPVPGIIERPCYAVTGTVFSAMGRYRDYDYLLHESVDAIAKMRRAAQLARRLLDVACQPTLAAPGKTTEQIDTAVHHACIAAGAYPSPLNYCGFPKSVCTSINEVVCHGIPDSRPLQLGDILSIDVSCFLNGVHGDNCATIVVGDHDPDYVHDNKHSRQHARGSNNNNDPIDPHHTDHDVDWRGVPYRTKFVSDEQEAHFVEARRLVTATRQSLLAGIDDCSPGGCISDIGNAIQRVADSHGYRSVEKYRGHGIGEEFHCPPFVKHFANDDRLELRPGMIFTIEPMLCQGSADVYEWDDDWTVVTVDGSLSAQFEHTVLITDMGVEILTLPIPAVEESSNDHVATVVAPAARIRH